MLTRREFIRTAALFALAPHAFSEREKEIWVNDVHSQFNRTRVRELLRPHTRDELAGIVGSASRKGLPISVSGCRHSMGGQQFATDSICIDTRELDRVISFDRERGLLEAEAGIQWPKLIRAYLEAQVNETKQWGIAQKQTGADTFTLGGSLSSNVHGRGLTMKPLISNIEAFTMITADGKSIRCSREENSELFRLAIGGYGLFGLIDTVTLKLVPRQKLRRVVEIIRANDLPKRFEERIAQKFLYGDFQFSVDEKSPDFFQRGVFSCYQPIERRRTDQSPKRSYAMMTGWNCCGLLTPTGKRRLSVTAITICRQTGRLIGPTQTNLAHISQAMRRSSTNKLVVTSRASSSAKSMCRAQTFPVFWRRQRDYCARIAPPSFTAPFD